MAIVMNMTWKGVSAQQYDAVQAEVRWESEPPDGGSFHVAWFEDGDMRIVDVWKSPEAFQAFVDNRLMPGVAKVGIEGQPDVQIHPAHRVFDAANGEVRS
jgi:hypothetical protein